MKKSTKIALFAGIGCFVLGICIIVIAAVAGGLGELNDGNSVDKALSTAFQNSFSIDGPMHGKKIEGAVCVAKKDEISKLEIAVGGAKVEFKESDNDEFIVEASSKVKVAYELKGDTLKIESKTKNNLSIEELVLYIPKGAEFESAKISLGAGEFKITAPLKVEDVKFEVGAGEVYIEEIEAHSAKFEVGAGSVYVEGMVDQLDEELAMGSFEFNGSIEESLDCETAMGDSHFTLTGDASDYQAKISVGAGSVQFFDNSYAAAFDGKIGDGDKILRIDCAMGEVTIENE